MDFILPPSQIPTIFSFKRMAAIYQPCLTQSICHKKILKATIKRRAEPSSISQNESLESKNRWNRYYLQIFIRNENQ